MAEAIPVELQKTGQGWQLLRGGEPYFIRGAGGTHSLEALAAAGGNSLRLWGAENLEGEDVAGPILDEAHALGISVTVGIWLGHERHGFDYDDPEQVATQLESVRRIVMRHKDHPALLMWGIGNEMEGFDDGDNPTIWKAVNDAAALAKELDPNHPTMTVTAFVHGGRIEYLHHQSPAIDIHGVNAYGGAVVIPKFLADGGATKPFVLTEYGPVGPWEMPKTEWGVPYEQTSTDKAAFYRRAHAEGIEAAPGMALGGYAFFWGDKMEGTSTWFGIFLEDGSPTAALDAVTEIWTGKPPDNFAPTVTPIEIGGSVEVDPGAVVNARTAVEDPEGEALDIRWVLRPDSGDYMTGGDPRPLMPDIEGAVIESSDTGARVRMPREPGAYRLFLYAYDPDGKAATANVPLLVKGESKLRLPLAVYEDGFDDMPWAPSGWMGNVESLSVDGSSAENPQSGDSCIRIRYEGVYNWAGVAWQDPPNNWGEQDGGYDLTGATALEVWMRGAYGGETLSIGVGLLENDKDFPDSGIEKLENIKLTDEWQLYRVPLGKTDLSSIKTGFFVSIAGRQSPVTIYLDQIRYVN